MNNASDTIGNRTQNLPACSAIPQSTTSLHALAKEVMIYKTTNCLIHLLPTVTMRNKRQWD
jgi:hypothetical protein